MIFPRLVGRNIVLSDERCAATRIALKWPANDPDKDCGRHLLRNYVMWSNRFCCDERRFHRTILWCLAYNILLSSCVVTAHSVWVTSQRTHNSRAIKWLLFCWDGPYWKFGMMNRGTNEQKPQCSLSSYFMQLARLQSHVQANCQHAWRGVGSSGSYPFSEHHSPRQV